MSDAKLIQDIHVAYQANFRGKGKSFPELSLVAVKCTPTRDLSSQVAQKIAKDNDQHDGWVRYRSALWSRRNGEINWAGDQDKSGSPLAAEWRIDDNTSVHLRPDPDNPGSFVEWTYTERACADGNAQNGEILVLKQQVLALAYPAPDKPRVRQPADVLIYHVYWGAGEEDPSAIRRLFSRFVSFDRSEDRVL